MFGIGKNIPSVDVEEVKQALDAKKDVIILDVRTAAEYKKGHIMNSIHLPLDMLVENAEKILKDKKQIIYIYCLSGSRSIHATASLRKLGYENAYNIKSGFLAWRAKKYPVIDYD